MTSLTAAVAALALMVWLSGPAAAADGFGETVWAQDGDGAAGDMENGVRAAKSGDWYMSIHYLERLIERDPQCGDALALLGASHRKIGNLNRAVRYFEAALAIDPDNRTVRGQAGEAYLALHRPEKARAHAGELAKLCPRGCSELTVLIRAIAALRGKGPGS